MQGPLSLPAWRQQAPKGMLTGARSWEESLSHGTSEVSDCQGLVFQNRSMLRPKRGLPSQEDSFYPLNLESDLQSVFDQETWSVSQNAKSITGFTFLLGISLGYSQY